MRILRWSWWLVGRFKWPRMRRFILEGKNGSGLMLLAFDAVLLGMWVVDLYHLRSQSLDYVEALGSLGFFVDVTQLRFQHFLILLLLPIVATVFVNFFLSKFTTEAYFKWTSTSTAKGWLLVVHMGVVILIIFHLSRIDDLTQLAGMCGGAPLERYCFISQFAFMDKFWFFFLGLIAFPLIGLIYKDALFKNRELAREFDFWRLIGASGEYQPAYGDEIIYANSASMAPSIKAINTQIVFKHHRYQTAVPTSDKAKSILLGEADQARVLLQDYLVGSDQRLRRDFNIEFFPGTSRALEAGLLRLGNVDRVILTQYEHPSQTDVARWLSATHGLRSVHHILPEAPSLFQEPWGLQQQKVCEAIRVGLDMAPDSRTAVVLSEVHFITGEHIQVAEIIQEVRRTHSNVIFVVDGSQSVGNLPRPFIGFAELLGPDDLYYFSAHKWLLSPNICGVLVSHIRNDELRLIQPYDVFSPGPDLPTSTIDPNTIFGLVSALEFLFGGERLFERFRVFSLRSRALFEGLAGRPENRFDIVQSSTGAVNQSLFVAVKPRLGMRWKYEKADFWNEMRRRGVDLTVVPEHQPYFAPIAPADLGKAMHYLLRISFPYFLVGKNVRGLVDHVNDLLEKAN